MSGSWTLPTISCKIQMLRPGEKARSHPHAGSTICHVCSGAGTTVMNGERYNWTKGDCFVLPLWSAYGHKNGSNEKKAILFSISDRPILESLGLYREESAAL